MGVGATAGVPLQEAAALQVRRQPRHGLLARPPRFAVVVRLPVTFVARAVPQHFVGPGEAQTVDRGNAREDVRDIRRPSTSEHSPRAVPENVPAIE